MDIPGGPAALAGMMMCVGLAAWTLGRWQGSAMAVVDRAAAATGEAAARLALAIRPPHAPARPSCHCSACASADYRGEELASASALGAMHEEISAYRRAEQILCDLSSDALHQIAMASGEGDGNCLAGAGGPVTAGVTIVEPGLCDCYTACRHTARVVMAERGDYPAVEMPAVLTRV